MEFSVHKGEYTEEDIKNDPDSQVLVMGETKMPDVDVLSGQIVALLEFMDSDEMVAMEKENPNAYEQCVHEKYEHLPFTVIKLLLERDKRDEHLPRLLKVLETLQKIKDGNSTYEFEHERFKEELHNQYI